MMGQQSARPDGRVPGETCESGGGGPAGAAGTLLVGDFDLDADFERWVADIDAGRVRIPEEREFDGSGVSVSLGDACDVDLGALAAMCGPDGLGGEALSAAFGQDEAADALRPGPVLAALTERAVSDLADLSDDQLTGALSAARRLENRAAYLQTVVIAEFGRRHEVEREAAKSRKVPLHCRPGQFPGEELACELVSTAQYADERIWEATDLVTRLPRTLAGMADGTIDAVRAAIIWSYTWSLTSSDAAQADAVLAAAAPSLRPDQLTRKAAALEMRLDPEAVKRRRERTRQDKQRVELKHERSGNAFLAGRELDPVTALAANANINALAVALRDAGGTGSLQHLRAWVMTELLQGRNPLGHLAWPARGSSGQPAPRSPIQPGCDSPACPAPGGDADADWPDDLGYRDDRSPGEASHRGEADTPLTGPDSGPGTPRGPAAPLPALINILVPAATMLGWSTVPASADRWGLLDAGQTGEFIKAASLSPRTRFCVTLIAPDGTALAHGCSRGSHPFPLRPQRPPPQPRPFQPAPFQQERFQSEPSHGPGRPPPGGPEQARQLADLIRRLDVAFRAVVHGRCDHASAEKHYTPSRGLKHLVRARNATCTAPACDAQAIFCDLDHTVSYPDGPTCQCNLAPACRRHHRCKQAPGWTVEQPEAGIMRWTVPSGRTYRTNPTVYDLQA